MVQGQVCGGSREGPVPTWLREMVQGQVSGRGSEGPLPTWLGLWSRPGKALYLPDQGEWSGGRFVVGVGKVLYLSGRGEWSRGRHPFPMNRMTDTDENTTLPPTTYMVGSKYIGRGWRSVCF